MARDLGPIIGIDLGTTFSSVAFLNAFGRAEVIPTVEGAKSIPSVVLFDPDGKVLVGLEAKERSVELPHRVIEFVKREMGDPDWTWTIDGKALRPQTLSAFVLKKLVSMVEGALDTRPTSAVITCPAYFGDLERQATAEAGLLAGLEVLSVFNEPTAAALAYGLHHAAKGDVIRALVYDLGGGTFDVTVLELRGRCVKVLATAGEHRLGGKDWDDELLNYVAEEFLVEFDQDPREDMAAQQDLRNRCEAAKVALSRKQRAAIFCRAYGETLKLECTRGLFEELTRPLLLQTKTYLDTVLRSSGLGWGEIDVILPVGGSSHMPQVHTLLREASGKSPERVLDPDLAIVQGAAYYAALLRAEEGFEIKVFSTRQPTGRIAKQARDEELPMLPPVLPPTMDETPELLGLPGEVASPRSVYAIPMLPGAVGEKPGPKVRRRQRPKERPGGRAPAAQRAPKPRPVAKGGPARRPVAEAPPAKEPRARPSERPAERKAPPKKRPPRRRPELPAGGGTQRPAVKPPARRPERLPRPAAATAPEALLPALPPAPSDALSNLAMGIALERPALASDTSVYDFADIVSLSNDLEDEAEPPRPVVNVNARSLGVLVHTKSGAPRSSVMIPANTQLPAVKRSRFFTINDNQTGVRVVVLEGESPDPEGCTRIGECMISGLPPRPRGQEVEISYSYDGDGRIEIWALDVATGQAAQVELKRKASLSQSQLADELTWIEGVY